ncbi:MAG TPA: CBS domain-containing protein [Abditibacteriaceae bacterium]|jgi:predicted transcriptional regulator
MSELSPEELRRIERFIAAYNIIDNWLQPQQPAPTAFRTAVDYFAKRNPWWTDAETLRTFAALRNFLTHEKIAPYVYPCVPTEEAVQEIEAICGHLVSPPRAGELFTREVKVFQSTDRLESALREMARSGYGVFPVWNELRFVGLLTATGITRWLATQVEGECLNLNVAVADVLPRERQRQTVRWAKPATPVGEVAFWFRENTFLEAVLLSEDGTERSRLRGIATRGDVAGR